MLPFMAMATRSMTVQGLFAARRGRPARRVSWTACAVAAPSPGHARLPRRRADAHSCRDPAMEGRAAVARRVNKRPARGRHRLCGPRRPPAPCYVAPDAAAKARPLRRSAFKLRPLRRSAIKLRRRQARTDNDIALRRSLTNVVHVSRRRQARTGRRGEPRAGPAGAGLCARIWRRPRRAESGAGRGGQNVAPAAAGSGIASP